MKRVVTLLLAVGLSGAIAVGSKERFGWLAIPGKLVGILVHSVNGTLMLVVTWLFYFGFFFAIALWLEQRRERRVEAR